ncbi:MAG: peptide chain release factor 3 [Myxococcota bacterium]
MTDTTPTTPPTTPAATPAESELQKRIREEVARRRTFAIISHPDAGKTTLTEKLLLYGGAIHLAGSVKARKASRHATSDWMEIEKQRGISVTTAVMQFVYDDYVVNILDTPGHQDFSEDTYRTLAAADAAVMLIDAAKGVEPQTEKLFRVCQLRGIPVFTFVNKMDRHGRDPLELMAEIESHLGMRTCPINWPVFDGADFVGVYERGSELVHIFQKGTAHGAEEVEAASARLGSAEADEMLTERAKKRLADDLELLDVAGDNYDLARVRTGALSPVFFGSALTNFGVKPFLESFLKMAPAPELVPTADGYIEATSTELSGFVFKIQANMDQAHRDRIAFFRVTSGRFVKGMDAWHPRLEKTLRLKNPTSFMARERTQIDEAFAGDIVGLFDTGVFRIGDSLTSGKKIVFQGIPHFSPELFRKVRVADPLRRKKLIDGLKQLAEEGAVQVFTDWYSEHPDIVGAVGTLQFDVLAHRLTGEYGCAPILTALPYTLCRWVVAKDPAKPFDARTYKIGQGCTLAHDRDGHVVVLFQNNWGVNWAKDQNKDFDLLPVSPLAEHAGSLGTTQGRHK